MSSDHGIAVVGMACAFPGAPTLSAYWRAICEGASAIRVAPASAFHPALFEQGSRAPTKIATQLGGFLDEPLEFDPASQGVMPTSARGAEPDQLLALQLAADALKDAGLTDGPPSATAVILGHAPQVGPSAIRYQAYLQETERVMSVLRQVMPELPEALIARVGEEMREQSGVQVDQGAGSLTSNLVAGRIANRFGLDGPCHTVDAACASTLIAVDLACARLRANQVDVAITGGVHLARGPVYWSVFTQLGALSASGHVRPFDRRADGILIGEGAGLLVLKRLADAERAGDRIYAVIAGTGTSNDGRGKSFVAPRTQGQLLALERAWSGSGCSPREIGYVEAHGTGTPTGDVVELETLRRFFGGPAERPAVLGAVKSQIGHAMAAAGAAGLIKTVLALHHGVQPGLASCEEPLEGLDTTRFVIPTLAQPWPEGPRLAGVNAFGFGGSNAHVVLREHSARPSAQRFHGVARAKGPRPGSVPVAPAFFAAATRQALLEALREDRRGGAGPVRLAVTEPSPARLQRAARMIEQQQRGGTRAGIVFADKPLLAAGGRCAVLFPGFDGAEPEPLDDLLPWLGTHADPRGDTERTGSEPDALARAREILAGNAVYLAALRRVRVPVDVMLGHSLGELSALLACGRLTELHLPGLVLPVLALTTVTLGCDAARATRVCESIEGASISHDNAPSQVLVALPTPSTALLLQRCSAAGIIARPLAFAWGIHSPAFGEHNAAFVQCVEGLDYRPGPQGVSLYSATTCARYPDDAEGARRLATAQLVRPVRFREAIEQLYADGARVFIQAGQGSLVSYVEDTLRARDHAAIGCVRRGRSALSQLTQVACVAWVHGADPDFGALGLDAPSSSAPARARASSFALDLSTFPEVTVSDALRAEIAAHRGSAPLTASEQQADQLLCAHAQTLTLATQAQTRVMQAWTQPTARANTRGRGESRRYELQVSPESWPELADHALHHKPRGLINSGFRGEIMPMAGFLHVLAEAAAPLMPELVVEGFEDVRARKPLVCAHGGHVTVEASRIDATRVRVQLGAHADGVVRFAEGFGAARAAPSALCGARKSPIDAEQVYGARWLFHGPAYQGIRDVSAFAETGVSTRIVVLPARGALLDAAVQGLGIWNAYTDGSTCLPVYLRRLTFYGPHPAPPDVLDCETRVVNVTPISVEADVTLLRDGVVWAAIEGWEVRRLHTHPRLWQLGRWPERTLAMRSLRPGVVTYRGEFSASIDVSALASNFLDDAEYAQAQSLDQPAKHALTVERALARDAVRSQLFAEGHDRIYPCEVRLRQVAAGRFEASFRERPVGSVSLREQGAARVAQCVGAREVGGVIGLQR